MGGWGEGPNVDGKTWQPIEQSRSIPFLRVAGVNPFVARIGVDDDTSILVDFAAWLKTIPAPTNP